MSTPQASSGEHRRPGIFGRLYAWMLQVAEHPRAAWWLGAVSFAESSFFPIPPDVMLAPMVLARRERWLSLATVATIASVAGGALGYAIGYFLIDRIVPFFDTLGWTDRYAGLVRWFAEYGVWVVVVKGLTPIPYKLITITAGAARMPFAAFMAASVVCRAIRFFAVAAIMRWAAPGMRDALPRYVDRIGWGLVILIVACIAVYALR
ncbi:MAG TPA: YqaA family protein [Candidatus Binatia bacterium]|nr:YqaA family protein [Candidatus Binatia bacterium]